MHNELIEKVIFNGIEYLYFKDEKNVYLRTDQKNKDGFIIDITISRDEKENQEAYEAVKEFFIREIL
jgi:hypothetical protein